MKTKTTKRHGHAPHPWAELSKLSLFTIPQLRVLHDHHMILHRFCVDPEKTQREEEQIIEPGADDQATVVVATEASKSESESSLDMSFDQYVLSVRSLIKYGSTAQQFEYLFQTYAVENERGISRSELFQLLQDHFKPSGAPTQTNVQPGQSNVAETRHFERLYTWIKKHFNVYDRTRSGFLSQHLTLELLQMHPDALSHIQLQVDPFLKKVEENNKQYQAKAQAAAINM